MTKSKPYSLINVNRVNLAKVMEEFLDALELWVGIDVGKEFLTVVVCWGEKCFSRPWLVRYPDELGVLLELLGQLARGRKLSVAIEPTGSYADPLRYALTQAELPVVRIASKASHDYAEIFDGVPSQHDGKDAAGLAELCRHGKGTPWPLERKSDRDTTLRSLVEQADDQQKVVGVWSGRLEGLLARHWPEATRILSLDSMTLLRALVEYASPAALAADPLAEKKLCDWGGVFLDPQKVRELIASARRTRGVPANAQEQECLRRYAGAAFAGERELTRLRRELEKLAKGDADLERIGQAVGLATACVLYVFLGHPGNYTSVRAYLKAAGLNLRERSSGKYQGQLKITKRGPALVRKWLYLAAMRLLKKEPSAAGWFARKRERDGGGGRGRGGGDRRKQVGLIGVVALMRRLLGAVWHITRKGEEYDSRRLFGPLPGSRRRRAGAAR